MTLTISIKWIEI